MIRSPWLAVLTLVFVALLPSRTLAQHEDGRRAVQRYGCASCHQVPGVRAPRASNCVGCHQQVVNAPRSGLGRGAHVTHYLNAPDLRSITRRLREALRPFAPVLPSLEAEALA